jgi:uncharacterized membrane protein
MRVWWCLALLLAALAAGPALAQETGGSFGGGSFGGGSEGGGSEGGGSDWGSSGSSSGSDWGSPGSSSDWGSSGSAGSSSGGDGGAFGVCGAFCCIGIVILLVVGFALMQGKKGGGRPMGAPPATTPGGPPLYYGPQAMHVSQLSLGIDWRARRELQARLMQLAQTGDTRSKQGLATLLRETVLALRRAELSWLYCAHKTVGPASPQNAESTFHQLATSARSSFRHEVVRGAGGQLSQSAGPNVAAHANEGEGTVVVHVLVAAYRPLAAPMSPDASQIRSALDNRAALTADQLGALEVIWSPAAENDRLSTAELEQFYPDLRLIDPNSIAGRIFCSYCRGPFAMELLSCPHCGAPAEASRDNRSPR